MFRAFSTTFHPVYVANSLFDLHQQAAIPITWPSMNKRVYLIHAMLLDKNPETVSMEWPIWSPFGPTYPSFLRLAGWSWQSRLPMDSAYETNGVDVAELIDSVWKNTSRWPDEFWWRLPEMRKKDLKKWGLYPGDQVRGADLVAFWQRIKIAAATPLLTPTNPCPGNVALLPTQPA